MNICTWISCYKMCSVRVYPHQFTLDTLHMCTHALLLFNKLQNRIAGTFQSYRPLGFSFNIRDSGVSARRLYQQTCGFCIRSPTIPILDVSSYPVLRLFVCSFQSKGALPAMLLNCKWKQCTLDLSTINIYCNSLIVVKAGTYISLPFLLL